MKSAGDAGTASLRLPSSASTAVMSPFSYSICTKHGRVGVRSLDRGNHVQIPMLYLPMTGVSRCEFVLEWYLDLHKIWARRCQLLL
jgi:hypothetical protein